MTLTESKQSVKSLREFFKQNDSLPVLVFLSQLWVILVPYLFPYVILAYFGGGCGGIYGPFDNSIWFMWGITHLINIMYYLYLFFKKEISIYSLILFPLIVAGFSLSLMFFIAFPMC
jgi:hypothetical protein